jgi:protein N-terminal methyltransferase
MKFISIGPWMSVQWSRQASFVLLIYIFQGAGIGRVTKDVLLHLFSEVVLLEPVQPLIAQALATSQSWKGINDCQKSVLFLKQPLQGFDPSNPVTEDIIFAHAGAPIDPKQPRGYDVIWCQWCLGHLSDTQLVRFLKQSQQSLRTQGVIIVKENCCAEEKPGEPESIYDPDDSSITRHVGKYFTFIHLPTFRSDKVWLKLFASAGLTVMKQEVQKGFPDELYEVKTLVLTGDTINY